MLDMVEPGCEETLWEFARDRMLLDSAQGEFYYSKGFIVYAC